MVQNSTEMSESADWMIYYVGWTLRLNISGNDTDVMGHPGVVCYWCAIGSRP
jgi:hypothetical protein